MLLVGSLLAAGCSGGSEEGSADGRQRVVVDGSSTVYRISREAQLDFQKVAPEIEVPVANHGTSGGFERYLAGEVDVIDASRDAKPEETEQSQSKGLEWTRFLIGYDGITVVVNPKNQFVMALSVPQLKALYAPESKVTHWSDLDPAWPHEKIILYAPDTSSGTFDYFTEEVVGKGIKKHRRDTQPSEDDNQLVAGVAGDDFAIGYFGFPYYKSNEKRLRAVPIRETTDSEPVEASRENIISKAYRPLARPLYIFVKNASLKRPSVAKFVKHYLDNCDRLATKAGYVPPTEADRLANEAAFANASSEPATAQAQ
jgi:phosphate transport system substrate-binding protein